MAAFNSLPTSKGVSVTPNAAPAPAAGLMAFARAPQIMAQAMSAPSMSRMMAAPSLQAGPIATVAVQPGITINVNGGIESSDAIARAVKRVVLGRDRRTGGVIVGEMRARVGHS
jgi:hypothetical protein